MIFVTVGTYKFDKLVKAVDELVEKGKIKDEVFAQIGIGEYIPKNFGYVRLVPSLEPYYEKANIIIASAGSGTIFENIQKGRKLIVVTNKDLLDAHQDQLAEYMDTNGYLIWCKDLSQLDKAIVRAKRFTPKVYQKDPTTIHLEILKYIKEKNRI